MAITRFDRTNLKMLRTEMDAALKAIADRHGIQFKIGSMNFTHDSFRTKIEAACGSPDNGSIDEREFRQYAFMYDLSPDDFGKEVRLDGQTYKVAAIRPKARKNPIILSAVHSTRKIVVSASYLRFLLDQAEDRAAGGISKRPVLLNRSA